MKLDRLASGAGEPASPSDTKQSVSHSAALDQTSVGQHTSHEDGRLISSGRTALTLTINRDSVTLFVDPSITLVEVLRREMHLTGTKVGCDRGACSSCTVWIDGEVAASCMTFALDARGKEVTTIEGLARTEKLHPVQRAFIEHDAMQCGFCTPGMVMSCAALLKHNPNPGLDHIKKAISGHLCRCGTYNNVFKAVMSVSGASGIEKSNV
ncbi:MAG: (2Fe-2S)-binding protein [Candidatus Korobacteraceae bacterium]